MPHVGRAQNEDVGIAERTLEKAVFGRAAKRVRAVHRNSAGRSFERMGYVKLAARKRAVNEFVALRKAQRFAAYALGVEAKLVAGHIDVCADDEVKVLAK